ncbi:type II secretion system minor pseudopilin GspI [uncultured Thiothrix sp.]|uniref:type II secretion system minor pseudopilin GspI n=1 Tax=uncultured Thiothrix sp. TaxID=223185 RepID=UPI00261FD3B1|nr:type II secretion system minor pseudopilin GspI [uncultured Thiothrix sp.]
MSKAKPTRTQTGFSLVEVMFALFIITLVIGIASQVAANSVRNAQILKEATFARWVGLNQLDLYQMAVDNHNPEPAAEGEEEMGNIPWRWQRETRPSSSDILLEVKVSVFHGGDSTDIEPVAVVKGYIPPPSAN